MSSMLLQLSITYHLLASGHLLVVDLFFLNCTRLRQDQKKLRVFKMNMNSNSAFYRTSLPNNQSDLKSVSASIFTQFRGFAAVFDLLNMPLTVSLLFHKSPRASKLQPNVDDV